MSDSARLMSQSLAKRCGGSYIDKRYYEIVDGKHDKRDAKTIVKEVIAKAGLEVIE